MATPAQRIDIDIPTIVLVGRVNVGKSTLFNRLIEKDQALVSNIPGTTRTSNEGYILWRGMEIQVIDTGGLTFDETVPLEKDIIRQSELAIEKADIVLFVGDVTTGVLPQERELAKRLHKKKSMPVILVANKADKTALAKNVFEKEWQSLGFGIPMAISAINGRNLGDLLDLVYEKLTATEFSPLDALREKSDDVIRVSIIGKPNVGKSSLFNKLIGEDRVIVNEMAHTTREPFDTQITFEYKQGAETLKQEIVFVDTAGIRRKTKVSGVLERKGIMKSIEAIDHSDIVLFVIDGTEPISSQDMQLGGLLERHAKSVIILVNKWDLSDDSSDHHRQEVKKIVESYFPHLYFAPLHFVSGKTGYRVHDIFPILMRVWRARHTQIPDKAMELFLKQVVKKHAPSRGKGSRQPSLMGMKQIAIAPPVFELAVKYRTSLHRSYLNFMEHIMRDRFDFLGTPILIKLRKQKK